VTDINVDELGPVDYLVVGLPAEQANFSGEHGVRADALIAGSIYGFGAGGVWMGPSGR
jgi:hypothetical protein